jgi:hypothetical protein
MTFIRAVLTAILGLFVSDGFLTLALLAVTIATAAQMHTLNLNSLGELMLVGGACLALALSIWRA